MRKALYLLASPASVLLAGMLLSQFLYRWSLPYNDLGRYFDAENAVVYDDSALLLYGSLSLISAALAIAVVWNGPGLAEIVSQPPHARTDRKKACPTAPLWCSKLTDADRFPANPCARTSCPE